MAAVGDDHPLPAKELGEEGRSLSGEGGEPAWQPEGERLGDEGGRVVQLGTGESSSLS